MVSRHGTCVYCLLLLRFCLWRRPYFTYWVTFVQLACFFFMIAVYGLAEFGFDYTNVTQQVSDGFSSV